jgi:hypothetical protein
MKSFSSAIVVGQGQLYALAVDRGAGDPGENRRLNARLAGTCRLSRSGRLFYYRLGAVEGCRRLGASSHILCGEKG